MIILILAVITYGCKDSLGIEPNPKITYIDKPPYKNTKYAIKNIYLTINEKYNFIETYNWDTNYIPIAYDLFIDTVSQVPFMWFNFKLKSLKMTPGFPRRNDWVSEVEFRADSINPIGTILLTEPKYKNRWYNLSIFVYTSQQYYNYTENQASAMIKFYEFNPVNKLISGSFEVSLFATSALETNSLIVFFRLNY